MREDENNTEKWGFVQYFNQGFQADVQQKISGTGCFLSYMSPREDGDSLQISPGKHWIRALF